MRRRFLPTAGLLLALADSASAQTGSPQSETTPEPGLTGTIQKQAPFVTTQPGALGEIIPEERPTEVRAGKIIGMEVTNGQGETLATVSDLIIDRNGSVTGLVVSTGGFLGFGAKPVGISWSAVADAAELDTLAVDLTKEQLAMAPEFKTKEAKQEERLERQDRSGTSPAPPASTAQ